MNNPYNIQELQEKLGRAPTNHNPGGSPQSEPSLVVWEPTMELRVFVKSNKKHTIQQKWIETATGEFVEWRDLPVVHEGDE